MSILFFFTGLFIGSFLLVVIDRFPRNESIFFGRSHCDMCDHTLAWYDLIPLLSYFLLRGKCRYCHKAYGTSYPIVELITAIFFASIPFFFPSTSIIEQILLCIAVSSCIVIFFCDLLYGLIPDGAVGIIALSGVLLVLVHHVGFLSFVLSSIGAGLFFFLLYIFTKKKGMGLGDVKLAAAMGFLLGYPLIILALYTAFLTGAIVALILILRHKKKFKGGTISFGPFLILGTYIALIGGVNLWNFFIHLLFRL